ncbi:hypothetical protein JCM10207_002096 [Rhodosporidiobolus poonsookiae]
MLPLPASPGYPYPTPNSTTGTPEAHTDMDGDISESLATSTKPEELSLLPTPAPESAADTFPLTSDATMDIAKREDDLVKHEDDPAAPPPFDRAPSSSSSVDRKPSLPPPFPFASTSASVHDIDEKRSTPGSRSGSASGASTTMAGESGEDSEDKPLVRPGSKAKGKKKAVVDSEPQLIGDLPLAEEAAAATYVELPECTYASQKLGNMAYFDEDATRCDCFYRADEPLEDQACGDHSNCMNRLMQIECVKGDCRCGRHCQNQRFQKKQYAPIEIVKTEKKGFGVRAGADMPADCFVYEYIGEVIGPKPFERKLREYANEGIKHFYFMALDREVFIDATKKGGKGRFLNHSCNPNCVVAKWTVGQKMRMGIFTKRAIQKHEELTFNYNVDRYGHVAQECFCGEPNCVGFIGGKTQTDLGGMDDLYIDALGIAEEVAALGLKGSKKKKGRKLDEDFVPTLYPVQLDEVPKVSAAMRQAIQTRRILEKLLTRVQMTTDEEVQRNLLRLHGLNLMHNILREYPKDVEVVTLDLQILAQWKLQTRNKIESSNIEESVVKCVEMEDDKIKSLAKDILAAWGELTLGYRIPKAELGENADGKRPSEIDFEQIAKRARLEEETVVQEARPAFVRPTASAVVTESKEAKRLRLPDGWEHVYSRARDADIFVHKPTGQWQFERPRLDQPPPPPRVQAQPVFSAADLIAQAEKAARDAAAAEAKRVADEKAAKEAERAERHAARKQEKEDKANERKEKKVMGLFSGVVVATMSKYKAQFEADAFKKRAKELSEILCEKEKKRPTYATDSYDAFTPEKEAKVKAFVKDWVKKLLDRKKSSSRGGSSNSTPKRPEAVPSPATPAVQPMEVDTPIRAGNGGGGSPGTPPRA